MIFPLKRPLIVDFPMFFIICSYLFHGFPWFSHNFPMIFHQKLGFPEAIRLPGYHCQVSSLNCSAVAHDVVVPAAAAREAAAPEANLWIIREIVDKMSHIWFMAFYYHIYHILYDFISLLISSWFFDEICAKSLAQNLGMLEGMIIYDNPASVDVEKQNKVLTHFYTCYLTNPSRYAGKRWEHFSFSTIKLGEPISDGREMFRNSIFRQMVERTQPCQFFNHNEWVSSW